MSKKHHVLGLDIGGTGIKGAIVDVSTGELLTDRVRVLTPNPATPKAVGKKAGELVKQLAWKGPIGCGFPAIIKKGVSMTATNVDNKWIGTNVEDVISKYTGCPVKVLNDADAAAIAEMRFGEGVNETGSVLLITIGTGLGTALFTNGILYPNTELGHIGLKKTTAENYASNAVRQRKKLSWKTWGKRFNVYLEHIDFLLCPDLIILGGGASKKFDNFREELKVKTRVTPAGLQNAAGTIGAAVYAYEQQKADKKKRKKKRKKK